MGSHVVAQAAAQGAGGGQQGPLGGASGGGAACVQGLVPADKHYARPIRTNTMEGMVNVDLGD